MRGVSIIGIGTTLFGVLEGVGLKAMAIHGLKVEDIFKRTLDGVSQRYGNKQTPWVSSSFRGEFYLLNPTTMDLRT